MIILVGGIMLGAIIFRLTAGDNEDSMKGSTKKVYEKQLMGYEQVP